MFQGNMVYYTTYSSYMYLRFKDIERNNRNQFTFSSGHSIEIINCSFFLYSLLKNKEATGLSGMPRIFWIYFCSILECVC